MFDYFTKLVEGKNINWKMTLRNQLKNVKIQNAEIIQSYFTRVSQMKEEECEECKDHTVILYKGLSNQRTNCSSIRRSGE